MNKRIRKKRIKRTLCGLLAAYDEYEAARERIWQKALRNVADACGEYREAMFRGYMEAACLMASSGPPPSDYTPVSAPPCG